MRQDGGSQGHPLIHVGDGLMELMSNGCLYRLRQLGLVHHLADKIPIAFFGWDTPSRGMRLTQIPHLCQRSHFIADGGRGNINVVMLYQPLRTNRLSRFNIITDDQYKKSLLTFAEFSHIFTQLALSIRECYSTVNNHNMCKRMTSIREV